MKGRMMVKWNWRKSRIIFPRENEHLVVITFCSPSCLGHSSQRRDLSVFKSSCHLFITFIGGFTFYCRTSSRKVVNSNFNQVFGLTQLESNLSLPFQLQTLYPLDHCSNSLRINLHLAIRLWKLWLVGLYRKTKLNV